MWKILETYFLDSLPKATNTPSEISKATNIKYQKVSRKESIGQQCEGFQK